jgi:hypothetical protein
MLHQFLRVVFVAGLTGLVGLAFWPYHDGALRYGLPLSLLAVWSAGLVFVWRRKSARIIVLVLPVLAAIPFCLPAKPLDPTNLRDRYVAAMKGMEGVPYIWGGERHHGVDCSGLPRLALRDALWEDGLKHANGAAFREWARQWWFDTSAKALGENYRDFTRPTGVSGKLRDLDFSKLVSGDLAITADGSHVMIYLGNSDWIQADPILLTVTDRNPSNDPNPVFNSKVSIQRWTILE